MEFTIEQVSKLFTEKKHLYINQEINFKNPDGEIITGKVIDIIPYPTNYGSYEKFIANFYAGVLQGDWLKKFTDQDSTKYIPIIMLSNTGVPFVQFLLDAYQINQEELEEIIS